MEGHATETEFGDDFLKDSDVARWAKMSVAKVRAIFRPWALFTDRPAADWRWRRSVIDSLGRQGVERAA